ncbi:hypothetical protein ISS04_02560 [Candidatus Woesearchaeota archaeon]|nr:hypothetical protein [Candidatus Woesearchaeota archaeon]
MKKNYGSGRLGGLWGGALALKGSVAVGLLGAFLAYTNIGTIKEAEYNLLDKNQKIETGYFQDPPGLETIWNSNGSGNIETFLQYKKGKDIATKIEIMEDMLPKTETMVEGLKERYNDGKVKGDFSDDYFELFKSSCSSEYAGLDSIVNNLGFSVRVNEEGKNELYLNYNDGKNSYSKKVSKELFKEYDNGGKLTATSEDKQKTSIIEMFNFLDGLYGGENKE